MRSQDARGATAAAAVDVVVVVVVIVIIVVIPEVGSVRQNYIFLSIMKTIFDRCKTDVRQI